MQRREFANQKALIEYAEQNGLAYEYEYAHRASFSVRSGHCWPPPYRCANNAQARKQRDSNLSDQPFVTMCGGALSASASAGVAGVSTIRPGAIISGHSAVVKTRRVASRPHGTQGMGNGGRPCSLLSASVV
jgi:hypothetical protein